MGPSVGMDGPGEEKISRSEPRTIQPIKYTNRSKYTSDDLFIDSRCQAKYVQRAQKSKEQKSSLYLV